MQLAACVSLQVFLVLGACRCHTLVFASSCLKNGDGELGQTTATDLRPPGWSQYTATSDRFIANNGVIDPGGVYPTTTTINGVYDLGTFDVGSRRRGHDGTVFFFQDVVLGVNTTSLDFLTRFRWGSPSAGTVWSDKVNFVLTIRALQADGQGAVLALLFDAAFNNTKNLPPPSSNAMSPVYPLSFDISAFAGQTVQVNFEVVSAGSNAYFSMFFDSVAIVNTCDAGLSCDSSTGTCADDTASGTTSCVLGSKDCGCYLGTDCFSGLQCVNGYCREITTTGSTGAVPSSTDTTGTTGTTGSTGSTTAIASSTGSTGTTGTTGSTGSTTAIASSTSTTTSTGLTTAIASFTGSLGSTTDSMGSPPAVIGTSTEESAGTSNANPDGPRTSSADPVYFIAGAAAVATCCFLLIGGVFLYKRKKLRQSSLDISNELVMMTPNGMMTPNPASHASFGGNTEYAAIGASVAGSPGTRSPTPFDGYGSFPSQPGTPVGGFFGGGAAAVKAFAVKSKEWDIHFTELKIQEEVGAGAFGSVFRAKWRAATVAVKVLRLSDRTPNELEALLGEFEAEAALMKTLRPHSNVVQFQGVAGNASQLAIISEFCPNGSVLDWLQDSAKILKPDMQLRWCCGIAHGMLHLHLEGVVHRDLAARNVLLSAGFEPKISDFGMSRVLVQSDSGGAESAQSTKTTTGPLRWMAPESLLERVYSPKTDVWAFGCTIFEILTRDTPYPGMDATAVSIKVGSDRMSLVDLFDRQKYCTTWASNRLDAIAAVMSSSLIRDPDQRPRFEELCEQLDVISEL